LCGIFQIRQKGGGVKAKNQSTNVEIRMTASESDSQKVKSQELKQILRVITCVLLVVNGIGCAVLGQAGGATVRTVYYAPAWGLNEKGEEVVYFLKQVTLETATDEQNRIYFCSIKPDGTERKEIAWLWKDRPGFFLDTYATAAHMEVNSATKRAVFGIGAGAPGGLFFLKLDGSGLQEVRPKEWPTNGTVAVSYPTWSPDGQWIAFQECVIKEPLYKSWRIAKCRVDGSGYVGLTDRKDYQIEVQPAWSPTTNLIAYVHFPKYYPGDTYLWLMNDDGSNKRNTGAWGDYPRWSPDGKLILHSSILVVDPVSGKQVKSWHIPMFPKWGNSGFVAAVPEGIEFTPPSGENTRMFLKSVSRPATATTIEEDKSRW
jgi:hypothetical protein